MSGKKGWEVERVELFEWRKSVKKTPSVEWKMLEHLGGPSYWKLKNLKLCRFPSRNCTPPFLPFFVEETFKDIYDYPTTLTTPNGLLPGTLY